ncbi:DUF4179 domain-containing protein [Paenibacillus dendritiformis]|uniref:DUF4179 domain-containing protein n=1 Tax=Paenibacillus dendritiformis C454 TaxID=1131935 RepID=H3SNR6_9BACL|nr:DUF4179 domain-containing protein [Paenibacillus dendritiformis]EHQ59285.1 hypothetical protein PDENDC454_26083 [Paenibacillus dendritiformis C454]CAH8773169.1 DUF4179 domain-containing protein [Paenibacillus dendritiformis]
MARYNLDKDLMECRNNLPDQLTPMLRSRLDGTYQLIRQLEPGTSQFAEPVLTRPSRIRKAAIFTAVVASMGVALVGAGFLSPTLAESLKSIPVLGSIFKLMGDAGLQKADQEGLVSVINENIEQNGISLIVPKVTYDGVRIAFELTRQPPKGTKGVLLDVRAVFENRVPKGAFDRIQVSMPGAYGSLGVGTPANEPSESVIVQLNELSGNIPDQFNMSVKVWLKGYEEPYELTVPVTKNTKDNITLVPEEPTKTYGNINFTIEKLELTPISTNLNLKLTGEPSIGGLSDINADIIDEQGRTLEVLSGRGMMGDTFSTWTSETTFEPIPAKTKTVTVKPYMMRTVENNKREKEYIPELEFTIPVKPRPAD